MNRNRLLKAGVPLVITVISVLLILWLSMATTDNHPATEPPKAAGPTASDVAATPEVPVADVAGTLSQLAAAQEALGRARTALGNASTGNHGGYVEKARADVEQAITDLNHLVEFAQNNPAIAALGAASSAEAQAAMDHVMSLHFATPNNQRSMVSALSELRATLTGLQQPGAGNLGPPRDTVILDIDRTATDVSDGFTYLRSGAAKKKDPATPVPADPAPPRAPLIPLG